MRGRKPKATKIHELNGNPSKINLSERERKSIKLPVENIKAPKYLDKVAKKEWKRVVPILIEIGVLSKVDSAALEAYCTAYSIMVNAATSLAEPEHSTLVYTTSNDAQQQLPQVGIFNTAAKQVKMFCSEFGLTPVARMRMTLNPKNGDGDDDMDKLLKNISEKTKKLKQIR